MQIRRAADDQPFVGSREIFTGEVEISAYLDAPSPATFGAGLVTFQPGARTAWHTHPLGQLLLITSGTGWVRSNEGREQVSAGDLVWCEPGERHWHGATTDSSMSHFTIVQAKNGTGVTWQEHVSDGDYQA